ncbi:hypothetical protein [Faecalibacter macacae]|uniref:Uncharacterized protein n=1 Tax=Faecalibacter macacae TaxID=1859289 RepID=A0A3L9MLZ5_9FLAO|nr:hypothetical protein [Faecalibacter macacae]RLZ12214.1 hypothetical protein EAH69_01430 [Faecalibacter macacae]
MNDVQNYIEELKQLSKGNLRICRMNWWLLKYEDEFKEAINQTSCKKWARWLYKGEHPYPCVCPKRDNLCVFIDLYRELDRLTQIQHLENYFEEKFNNFQVIKDSGDAIMKWMRDIRPTISEIYLTLDKNENLKVRFYNSDPILEVNINKSDYKYTLLCLDIFNYNMYVRGM